jgi:hypothetical protein
VTVDAGALRVMPLEAMAEVWRAADNAADEATCAAILAETDRRDRAAKAKARRDGERGAWVDAAHAQYLQADEVCRGNLVNRRGYAAGVSDWSLWSGPEARAMAYATEELREFWYTHPRMTVEAYRRQVREALRIQRDDADRAALEDEGAGTVHADEPVYEITRDGKACGRVTPAAVRHRGQVVTAWWSILPDGRMTLHADPAGALAAVMGMGLRASRHLPRRYARRT